MEIQTVRGSSTIHPLRSPFDCSLSLLTHELQKTTKKPQKYNIQIQVNKETEIFTLRKLAPQTVVYDSSSS